MDVLYLLIPLSAVLVLTIAGVLAWAGLSGQFEELEREGTRIFEAGDEKLDEHQSHEPADSQQSPGSNKANARAV